MSPYEIFSSGGVGDALIVGLKIQQAIKANRPEKVIWRHFEKHECHADACLAIQQHFADHSECLIMDTPEACALEMCDSVGGYYLDTKAGSIIVPYLEGPLTGRGFFHEKLLGERDYIVVQAQAGRMNDATRREIGIDAINQLLHFFPRKKLVVLGPEEHPFHTVDMGRTVNLTGKTESIIDALEVINDCALFVGQDGIMAYYAMMLKKPTIVNFHIPTLPEHYWNHGWNTHAIAMVGMGNRVAQLPVHEKIEKLLGDVQ